MSSKFKVNYDLTSDNYPSQNKSNIRKHDNQSNTFMSSQSVMLRKQIKQKDIYIPNKIEKNDFFTVQDCEQNNNDSNLKAYQSQIIYEQTKTQNTQIKAPGFRRKKVNTSIKLQPLKTLQLIKKTEKIELPQLPSMMKRQSEPVHIVQQPASQKFELQRSNTGSSSVNRQNLLNFQMNTSSDQSDSQQKNKHQNASKIDFKKSELTSSSNFFFEQQDEQVIVQKTVQLAKEQQQKPQLKQLKFKRSLKKQSRQNNNNDKQTNSGQQTKKQESNQKSNSQQNSQKQQKQAQVGIQTQLNPQKKKQQEQQRLKQQIQLTHIKCNKQLNFDILKRMVLDPLIKKSVLNLRLIRLKSLLNFFSPQFRLEFFQDNYFIMGVKKTSSRPTSTFIFSGSQFNFQQNSKKYFGKMKSNIIGNVYNIFGPGLNPSTAKNNNIQPRQLLATIIYKTELFGTGKPKQFSVFVKKPQYGYYRDLRGTTMYEQEIALNDLYYNYHENMDKIQVVYTRKPVFYKETKQYVMNFEGKVKKSSIKNFILEDRDNQNQKVTLFGKTEQDEYVLDVLHPFSPMIGIGVALTVFDSRLGSD